MTLRLFAMIAAFVVTAAASAATADPGTKPLPLWYAVVSRGLVGPAIWLGRCLRARRR
jgi:hypothetical protein